MTRVHDDGVYIVEEAEECIPEFHNTCYPGSQCAQSLLCKFLPAWEWFLDFPNTINSDATHTLSKSSASQWVTSGPYPVGKSPAQLLYLTHTFTCVLATT